jgi:hypothetical protein
MGNIVQNPLLAYGSRSSILLGYNYLGQIGHSNENFN